MSSQRMQRTVPRWFRLVAIMVVMAVAAGCSVSGRIEIPGGPGGHGYDVFGQVYLRTTNLPIVDATLTFEGPVTRTARTNRQGKFSVRLPAGNYRVTMHTVHGTYSRYEYISRDTRMDWPITPSWNFDSNLFYEISGLYRVFAYPNGEIDWTYGEIIRWEQPRVNVYFSFGQSDPQLANKYWNVVVAWRSILNDLVAFRQVSSPSQADVIVELVPAYSLGQNVAVLSTSTYENGALRQVSVKIDVRFADDMNLWTHEWARAMGMSYVSDRYSVLYPYYVAGQRNQLNLAERNHARLVYDLPSGLRLKSTLGPMAIDPAAENDEPIELVEEDLRSGYRGHMVMDDGLVLELTESEARSYFMLR